MKYFHSYGGRSNPDFPYRIKMPGELPEGAYEWCLAYPDQGALYRRFHCEQGHAEHKGYVIMQFEWEEAAMMFALRWL